MHNFGGRSKDNYREYAVITIYLLISRVKHSVWAATWKGWKKIVWQILEPSHNPDMKGTLIKSNFLKSPNDFHMCSHLLIFRNKQISTLLEYITLRSFLDSIPLCSLRYIVWVFFSYLLEQPQNEKLAHC